MTRGSPPSGDRGAVHDATWGAQTPCPEWRAVDLAGHLRCVADDYHEYLDDAPVSRYARLMATGAHPETLARKLARQNAAELAALPDVPPEEHIAAFARSATRYAARLGAVLGLPHHSTAAGSSPSPEWPGSRAWNGTCTPGIWPGRWASTTGPPIPRRCSRRGWPASRSCRCPARSRGPGQCAIRSLACCAGGLGPARGQPGAQAVPPRLRGPHWPRDDGQQDERDDA